MRSFWGKSWYVENINHLENDNGFDLFIPLEKIEPTEQQEIKY